MPCGTAPMLAMSGLSSQAASKSFTSRRQIFSYWPGICPAILAARRWRCGRLLAGPSGMLGIKLSTTQCWPTHKWYLRMLWDCSTTFNESQLHNKFHHHPKICFFYYFISCYAVKDLLEIFLLLMQLFVPLTPAYMLSLSDGPFVYLLFIVFSIKFSINSIKKRKKKYTYLVITCISPNKFQSNIQLKWLHNQFIALNISIIYNLYIN
jgi:hypothetical protein